MFCKYCGKEIADDAIICPGCGRAVDGAFAPQPAKPQTAVGSYSTLSLVGFILSFFVELAGLIISIIAYNNAKRDGDEKSQKLSKSGIIISSVLMGVAVIVVALAVSLSVCAALAWAYGY